MSVIRAQLRGQTREWLTDRGTSTCAKRILRPQLELWLRLAWFKPSHSSHLPAYRDGTECSETSAYKIQTLGNYPEESIQHSEHSESLKPRSVVDIYWYL